MTAISKFDEKRYRERLIGDQITIAKKRTKHQYRKTVRTKERKRNAEHRMLDPEVAIAPAVSTIATRRQAVEDDVSVSGVQAEMDELRKKWMARAVRADALDPSVLEGDITLPTELMELLEKENFSKEDMQRCALSITRDNMGELVALLKNRDPRVKLEAFRLLYQFVFGDATKRVEHTGPGGQAQQIIVRLVAPDGRERPVERPRLTSSEDS